MDTLDQSELVESKEIVTQRVLDNLRSTSPWMMLLGVLSVIMALLMIFAGIAVLFTVNQYSSLGLSGAMTLMALFYMLSGGMIGFGGYLLLNSGANASTFSKYPTAVTLERYTTKQKHFWTLMGVNAVVAIIFFIAFIFMASNLAKLAGAGM